MKRSLYKIAGLGLICFAFAFRGLAQDAEPVPPVPPVPPTESLTDSSDHPSEILIRRKGDKSGKVTIEIKDGNFLVNGKSLDKFNDENIEIEERAVREEPNIRIITSPFRGNAWETERFHRDLEERMHDANRRLAEIDARRSNEAFLGVSSRKAETGGATVLDITKGSPAEKAGLKKGDVITKVNDKPIESPDNLFDVIHEFKPGEKVKIVFKREGKEQSVSAVLDKSKTIQRTYNYEYRGPEMREYLAPEVPGLPGMESPIWGPMPPKLGIKAQDREEGTGVGVLEVTEGSAADKAGLKKGDVINSLDGKNVNSADELIQQIRESRQKLTVQLSVQRDGQLKIIDIRIPRKIKTAEL